MSRGLSVDLTGQTAVITGASQGIGEEMAYRMAESGANVVAAARNEANLEDTVETVEAEYGVEGLVVRTDLGEESDIDNLMERTVETFGAPEILVNNGGVYPGGPILEQPTEDIDLLLDVNVRGAILLTQRWGRAYRDSDLDSGRVINVASVFAHVVAPQMLVYASTKHDIVGVTRGFAAEFARDGVTVNSISPGLINSGYQPIEELQEREYIYDLDRIPAGRVGEPEDVANMALYLASEAAEYVTGEDLLIDGGVTFTAGMYAGRDY